MHGQIREIQTQIRGEREGSYTIRVCELGLYVSSFPVSGDMTSPLRASQPIMAYV